MSRPSDMQDKEYGLNKTFLSPNSKEVLQLQVYTQEGPSKCFNCLSPIFIYRVSHRKVCKIYLCMIPYINICRIGK